MKILLQIEGEFVLGKLYFYTHSAGFVDHKILF